MKNSLNLQPENVFHYFEELCKIPHGSGDTKRISDFCTSFAKTRNLEYYQDDLNNVIIIKEATAGYEQSDPVIIQGHLDMVCEKDEGVTIDFEKDGLDLYVDGEFLKARGTTLGGDDGIAVAYALAILDSNELQHPRLEVIFTVDEETGMEGVQGIDLTPITGKKLLNIDSDEEGVILTSCAGGMGFHVTLPVTRKLATGTICELKVHGLFGGHSGSEINKERASANQVMGRVLKYLEDRQEFSIVTLQGGQKDNAITRQSICELVIEESTAVEEVMETLHTFEAILKKEYKATDSAITLSLTKKEIGARAALDKTTQTKILFFLREMPFGVQHMSITIPGLVETSLNPGIMKLNDTEFLLSFSIRSSVQSRKYDVADKLTFLAEFLGGSVEISGDYPAWEYKEESKVRTVIADVYRDLFQEEPQITAIHAGLECGFLSGKIEGLDAVSFGPKNLDIHTPQERLSIASTKRYWDLLVEYLKRAK
ncbi:MAG: aminoacyl-histidine dipeptidase [Lachnospiraceae bacterium]